MSEKRGEHTYKKNNTFEKLRTNNKQAEGRKESSIKKKLNKSLMNKNKH